MSPAFRLRVCGLYLSLERMWYVGCTSARLQLVLCRDFTPPLFPCGEGVWGNRAVGRKAVGTKQGRPAASLAWERERLFLARGVVVVGCWVSGSQNPGGGFKSLFGGW